MRNAPALLCCLLCCLAPGLALAQGAPKTDAATPAPHYPETTTPVQTRPEPLVENIRHEDSRSRIDELRVGGVTQRITVQPKGGSMPAYELAPDNNRSGSGERGWKILGF